MSFEIVLGDITQIKTDAIANAANTTLLGGGGVDGAIHRRAGKKLLEECKTLGGCETGKAKITRGYDLPASYVLHTPGPIWHGGNRGEDGLLASCYLSCLVLAEEHGLQSVAFPSISTGVYRFPLERAAKIAVKTIMEYLDTCHSVRKVMMVCFDERTKRAYDEALEEYTAQKTN